MLESYRGTIDDEGETLDDARSEVRRTFDGDYGTFLSPSWQSMEPGWGVLRL
jgi:hypothetical protein